MCGSFARGYGILRLERAMSDRNPKCYWPSPCINVQEVHRTTRIAIQDAHHTGGCVLPHIPGPMLDDTGVLLRYNSNPILGCKLLAGDKYRCTYPTCLHPKKTFPVQTLHPLLLERGFTVCKPCSKRAFGSVVTDEEIDRVNGASSVSLLRGYARIVMKSMTYYSYLMRSLLGSAGTHVPLRLNKASFEAYREIAHIYYGYNVEMPPRVYPFPIGTDELRKHIRSRKDQSYVNSMLTAGKVRIQCSSQRK